MIIGYARTSTHDQEAGLKAQLRDLKKLGCERIYKEQVTAVGERPELEKVLEMLRPGDQLVVTKLDRLARSVVHLGQLVETIKKAKAHLKIANLGIDTSTPTGKLMLNVIGSVAEFELGMMKERQREGIEKAKAEGKYKGRKETFSKDKAQKLRDEGKSLSDIAHVFGVTRQAVHQRLKAA